MKSAFIVRPGGDVAEAAAFARDEEIDGLEVMFHGPSAEDFTGAAETKRIADDHEVEIAAVGVWHLGMADPKEAGSDEVLAAAMEYAAALEVDCIFTGAGEPEGDDPVGALAEVYPRWAEMAADSGMKLAVYLGHKGSFITTEELLADACERVEGLGLKLDPIGIIRNLEADPYDVLHRYGASTAYFHVKDRLRLTDGEIEPPPGLGELDWGRMFGILHQHSYDGYVSVEPHGKFWNQPEKRWNYIRLALRHVGQFMT
jgi:sugar phosphate isomerase/epimerase